MQLRQTTRFISGAWNNIYVRGKRPKRPAYMKPGRVVVVPVEQYLSQQTKEKPQ